jgi:hypothetical protein
MENRKFWCFMLLFVSAAAEAQQRVFVSAAHGDDVNACSVTAPCRSFAKAITAVTSGGEILVLDSGGYGPVTIGASVSIVSPAGIEGSITQNTSGQYGVVINAAGANVLLRGLSIFGGGTGSEGIRILRAASVAVQSCTVAGFATHGIDVNVADPVFLAVSDSTVTSNEFNGIRISGALAGYANFEIDHCRLENNSFSGLNLFEGGRGTLRDTVVSNNNPYGVVAQTQATGQTAYINVENCTITANGTGIAAASDGSTGLEIVRVSNTLVAHNQLGLNHFNDPNAHLSSRSDNSIFDNVTDGLFTDYYTAK